MLSNYLHSFLNRTSVYHRTARQWGPIVVLFAISVMVRVPYINRPLSAHYEWVTAPVLITQQIWYEEGAWTHHFLPVMTFPGAANRNISNDARMKNDKGVWYYTTSPPLAWIAPYVVFSLLGVYPDVLPLQIFNLVLHFVCAILVYALTKQLIRRSDFLSREIPALVAASVYLFTPFALWFHCNTYSGQWLNHPFFIGSVYAFVRILDSEEEDKNRWIWILGALVFLMFYTWWGGAFFSAVICAYAFFHRQERSMRRVISVTVFAAVLSTALVFFHKSAVAGIGAFIEYFWSRFSFASGYFKETDKNLHVYDFIAWKRILSHYYKGFGVFLIFLCTISTVSALLNERLLKPLRQFDKTWFAVICITVLPVLGEHLALFNYTAVHEYSVMPMLLAISTLTGLGLSSIISKLETTRDRQALIGNVGSIITVFVILIATAIGEYREQNNDGHTIYKTLGESIAKTAKSDEVVFVNSSGMFLTGGGGIIPHIVFYAHRNLAVWKDAKTARELLEANGVDRGIVFTLVREKNQYKFQHQYIERKVALSKVKKL